jgi:hypothetical protein
MDKIPDSLLFYITDFYFMGDDNCLIIFEDSNEILPGDRVNPDDTATTF